MYINNEARNPICQFLIFLVTVHNTLNLCLMKHNPGTKCLRWRQFASFLLFQFFSFLSCIFSYFIFFNYDFDSCVAQISILKSFWLHTTRCLNPRLTKLFFVARLTKWGCYNPLPRFSQPNKKDNVKSNATTPLTLWRWQLTLPPGKVVPPFFFSWKWPQRV